MQELDRAALARLDSQMSNMSLEDLYGDKLRIGFGYPGNKTGLVDWICPNLPSSGVRVDCFGGSGAVLLNSTPSELEIFNDKCSGVTAFYRCIQKRDTLDLLKERISSMVYSKEEFYFSRDSWESLHNDLVERAARWFYTVHCSFSAKGIDWGRQRKGKCGKLAAFQTLPVNMEFLHERIQNWVIENDTWWAMFERYDGSDTVWYLDPTYYDCTPGMYRNELSKNEHRIMLDRIQDLKGFVAISGYPNDLYDTEYDWDERLEFEHKKKSRSGIACEANNWNGIAEGEKREFTTEVLWIRDFR